MLISLKGKEEGFTLIEVLAALIILSIVFIAATSFFSQSLSFTKKNEHKTVTVNLARNALVYLEKQSFTEMKQELAAHATIACELTSAACAYPNMPSLDPAVLKQVLNPVVNGIQYNVTVTYQDQLHNGLEAAVQPYLLPVEVNVYKVEQSITSASMTRLEGYITDASIR